MSLSNLFIVRGLLCDRAGISATWVLRPESSFLTVKFYSYYFFSGCMWPAVCRILSMITQITFYKISLLNPKISKIEQQNKHSYPIFHFKLFYITH